MTDPVIVLEDDASDIDWRTVKEFTFTKGAFPDENDVRTWCKKRNIRSSALVDAGDTWVLQQHTRGDFKDDDFKTTRVDNGVSAEVGHAREEAVATGAEAAGSAVVETIRSEGSTFALYTKDNAKKLGVYQSRDAAALQEEKIARAATSEVDAPIGFARDVKTGELEVVPGGGLLLAEDASDVSRLSDGTLKKLRQTFVDKRTALRQAHSDMDDSAKYSSPEGAAVLDDLYYYNQLISRLENEMQCRMLPLDTGE